MKPYIGTKIIQAEKMTHTAFLQSVKGDSYNEASEFELGYYVIYKDGYESWSPKEAFEEAYRLTTGMNFGLAIEAIKKGCKVARSGWNGKDMWIVLMSGMNLPSFNTQGTERKVNDRTAKWIGRDTPLNSLPYIAMWTADKKWLPGWLASQTDMLSDDWVIVD